MEPALRRLVSPKKMHQQEATKMGKILLLSILLTILLPLTTTGESTVPPPSGQNMTLPPNQETAKAKTDAFHDKTAKTIPPTAEALKIVTSMETVTPTLMTQSQTIVHTINASSTEKSTSTTLFEENNTSENPESSTQSINTQITISSPISSGKVSSIQTSTMATGTIKVAVQTGSATTRAVPTAKLSATTEILTKTMTSDENATDSDKTTDVAQTKISSTTELVPIVQKTTAKVDKITETTKHVEDAKGGEGEKLVKHGKIVAGLIAGALLAMMIGFLVILYKKHKLKKHRIATTDWAGPTPFLETGGGGGGGNGHVTLRSASRISLTSFLPQRLSKRLSLLAESAEEMQDMQEMTTGTTFIAKERNGGKLEQMSEKSPKEADENNSEASGKTEEVDLADEENEGQESARKQNGQAVMKDDEKGNVEKAENESKPKEAGNEHNGEGEKNGVENVV